jgi:exosortase A-associated hydrolase 2
MFERTSGGAVREEPLWCPAPGGALYGMCYSPEREGPSPAVVIAAPDGEERVWATRSLVRSARGLAAAGCTVLRFDYRGQGESEGEYEKTTLDTLVEDLVAACGWLRERTGRTPSLLGVRLGAAVGLLAAAMAALELQRMVLWEPVVDTAQYLNVLLRVNVAMQMVAHGRVLHERQELIAAARAGKPVSVNGFNLSGAYIDGLLGTDLTAALSRLAVPTLVLAGGAPPAPLAQHPHVRVERIPIVPFWREPKVHIAGPPAFLGKTVEYLAPGRQDLREVS